MTRRFAALSFCLLPIPALLPGAFLTPTDVQLPGTQPLEVSGLGTTTSCQVCHGHYDPEVEPMHQWRGSPMAHSARDPVFWSAMAIAEQDFAGSGDFCLRCHAPRGWLDGRATPSDGSNLSQADVDGVECAVCHALVNPDDSEHLGAQHAPYVANDGGTPRQAYHGSGMMALWPGPERLGPYADPNTSHAWLQSRFHRTSQMCGTCHDVSNPVTGDLAHNNGAQVPLPAGQFSGQLGAPVTAKAAFKNFPYQYGVVERTFSEAMAAGLQTTRVADYASLPRDLQAGAIADARAAALLSNPPSGDYLDGSTRTFTCETCHMPPVRAQGCAFADIRGDMPRHGLVGANYWFADLLRQQDLTQTLRFGGGLDAGTLTALDDGAVRARRMLDSAAALRVQGDVLRVTNLTGHKLFTGYPEGRRMWIEQTWLDEHGAVLRVDGAYGPIAVTHRGAPMQVETLVDLSGAHTRLYEVGMGLTQEWAQQLLRLGKDPALPLQFDRVTGRATLTLGQLAAQPPGSSAKSFHFVLVNTVVEDNRIPPFRFRHDDARARNALPVPDSQYGNPGPGGEYRHYDELTLSPPRGAASARLRLLYQPTSWEYVQFLERANDGSVAYLAHEGRNLVDAWRATGMATPHAMATAAWNRLAGTDADLLLGTRIAGAGAPEVGVKTARGGDSIDVDLGTPHGSFAGAPAAVFFQLHRTGSAPPPVALPGLHLGRADLQVLVGPLPAAGAQLQFSAPDEAAGYTIRVQALCLSNRAANGTYAVTAAHDLVLQ
ncbi:MAG: hypothetical protein R3F56_17600 [Planctomycetota bacterium]